MELRCLVGPTEDGGFPLDIPAADVRSFSFNPGADLTFGEDESWDDCLSRLPVEWRPTIVVLLLGESSIPEWFWRAPVPVIGAPVNWETRWHRVRQLAHRCDGVLVAESEAVFTREGLRLVGGAILELAGRLTSKPSESDADSSAFDFWIAQESLRSGIPNTKAIAALKAQQHRRPTSMGQYQLALFETQKPSPELPTVAHLLQRAWQLDPTHVLAGAALAHVLLTLQQGAFATEQATRTLATLHRIGERAYKHLATIPLRTADAAFCKDWERAAWINAGNPLAENAAKVEMIRWQLHDLLGRLGDLGHLYEAYRVRPDATELSLGLALSRMNRHGDAIPYLIRQVARDPLNTVLNERLTVAYQEVGLFQDVKQITRIEQVRPQQTVADEVTLSVSVDWHGPVEGSQPISRMNRRTVGSLVESGFNVLVPPGSTGVGAPTKADLHISDGWAPNFSPPEIGHWVTILPVEFGSIPAAWARPLRGLVDEIWTSSRAAQECLCQVGIAPDRIQVIAPGVDGKWLEEPRLPFTLRTTKRFRFLFVGDLGEQDGFDILLKAYSQVFSATEDVCLIVRDNSGGANQSVPRVISAFQSRADNPELEYVPNATSVESLMQLYDACGCLVHPFRAAGFLVAIPEAMGRGLPVIATGFGAAMEYCQAETAFLLPAKKVPFADDRIGNAPSASRPFVVEPDRDALRDYLRYIYDQPEVARQMGERALDMLREKRPIAQSLLRKKVAHLLRQPPSRIRSQRATTASSVNRMAPGISLCMIVKNEESNLRDCLASVADLVDEIVIVDTGSTDGTKDIASEFQARVFDFPWIDSFAAARNESIRHARHQWIIWMDADDRLDESNRNAFRQFRSRLADDYAGYVMKCLCLPDKETGSTTIVDHVRLFRNDPRISWKYRIHEQILPSIRSNGGDVEWADVTIHHTGYQDPALKARKRVRDLRLLNLENTENPNDPFTLFNLGQIHQDEGQLDDALACFRKSLALSNPRDSIVRKMYSLIAQILRSHKKLEESLATCRDARAHYPDDPEILFQEALTRQDLCHWEQAAQCYFRVLEGSTEKFFTSSDPGLRGYKARHNLGTMLRELKNDSAAEEQWWLALEEKSDFLPTLAALAELLLSQRKWSPLEEMIGRLQLQDNYLADLVFGQSLLARKRFTEAKACFERLIVQRPDALRPKVLLTHVLLQAEEWDAAEVALRAVLSKVPDHREARQNLEVLLTQQRRKVGENQHRSGVKSRFAVAIVARSPHSEAVREVAESIHYGLLSLGHDSIITTQLDCPHRQHIVLCPHLLLDGPMSVSPDSILYNLEQISPQLPWLNAQGIEQFRKFRVWDYSEWNIRELRRLGIPRVQHLPIGYVPQLTRIRPNPEEDIDVLFYGSTNERRNAILNALRRSDLKVETLFGVYGPARDRFIARSKIVLNMHFYDAKIFETARVSYLLANRRFVVSERGADRAEESFFEGGIAFADYEDLVDCCRGYVENHRERARIAEAGFQLMANRDMSKYLRLLVDGQ